MEAAALYEDRNELMKRVNNGKDLPALGIHGNTIDGTSQSAVKQFNEDAGDLLASKSEEYQGIITEQRH